MAKHEVTVYENAGKTRTNAPYLGTYLSKETVRNEKFAAVIAAKSGLPAIQVQAVLDGCFEAIEELEKDALVRIHLDGLSVMGGITGAFPASNSPFDPEKNRLLPVLQLDEAIRFSLTDETPAILTAADLTRLRIDNVADVVITGANLAGASVKIKYKTPPEEERQTYVCPAVVAEDGKITIAYENWRFVPDDIEADTTIEFIVETAGGSANRNGIEVDLYPPAP